MLVSRKTVRASSLCLYASRAGLLVLNPYHPTPSLARYNWPDPWARCGSPQAGRGYKGFHTREADAQLRRRKWQRSFGKTGNTATPKDSYSTASGSRASGRWRKPTETAKNGKEDTANEGPDWYSGWESHKRSQYEAFVKDVQKDPYQALFGQSNRWLGWLQESSFDSPVNRTFKSSCQSRHSPLKAEGHTAIIMGASKESASARDAKPQPSAQVDASHDGQEYDIDPITLRKVPRKTTVDHQKIPNPAPAQPEKIEISVKKYKSWGSESYTNRPSWIPSSQANEPTNLTSQNWLLREKFARNAGESRPNIDAQPSNTSVQERSSDELESSLDRHIKALRPRSAAWVATANEARPGKAQQDDVDILRASDVRAHSGLRGRAPKESTSEKEVRQKSPEKLFDELPPELGTKTAGELACDSEILSDEALLAKRLKADSGQTSQTNPAEPENQRSSAGTQPRHPVATTKLQKLSHPDTKMTSNHVAKIRAKLIPLKTQIDILQDDYVNLRRRLLDEKRRIEETNRKKAARQAQELLDQEIKAQKDAVQAIELRCSRSSEKEKPKTRPLHSDLRGEGDMASNVHEFADRARWYKRKAPHAQCEMDSRLQCIAREKAFVREIRGIYEDAYGTISTTHRQADRFSKLTEQGGSTNEQPARSMGPLETYINSKFAASHFNRGLREVAAELDQDINKLQSEWQKAGSTILPDSVAQQCRLALIKVFQKTKDLASATAETSAQPGLASHSNHSQTSVYRILAYDSSAQKVTSAKTESQAPLGAETFTEEHPLTTLRALNGLHNPGKFLPHITSLQGKGYEVVSGTSDILLLKKVRELITHRDDFHGGPNPIDGTTTPEVSTGNFASPTGYVNYDSMIPLEEQRQGPIGAPRSTDKVHRQEAVFSGTSALRWQDTRRSLRRDKRKARRRQTIKGMLLTGTVTAAMCYMTGVVHETMHM